jgi:hypothetical protein
VGLRAQPHLWSASLPCCSLNAAPRYVCYAGLFNDALAWPPLTITSLGACTSSRF